MEFLKYNLTLELPLQLPKSRIIANTINPHSYCVAKEDMTFYDALVNSDILVPDGVGVVWASQFLYKREIFKISGYDMHLHFLRLVAQKKGGKVFYLGSSTTTLDLIIKRLRAEFPTVQIRTFSPPYKANFTQEENQEMIEEINEFRPDVLFVGMTAPKQEKWVYQHREAIEAKVICSIGAVFDFYAGTVKRPSKFWVDLGLEWLPRFLKEPKRLWRRNLVSTPQFIFDILKLKLKA